VSDRPAFLAGAVYVDTSGLDELSDSGFKADKIVREYGLAITLDAAKNAPVASMETSGYVGGALRNSITSESYSPGFCQYIIQDGVEYGIYQEFGTSRMAAQPWLIPAVEKWREKFLSAFAELFK
jgi:HK97 gp10 family phage protein